MSSARTRGTGRTTLSWAPTKEHTIRNRERAVFERLLAEKDRLILVLTEQIDYLRAERAQMPMHGGPAEAPLRLDQTGLPIPSMGDNPLDDGSEPEDELKALRRDGLISEEELEQALRQLVPDYDND